MTIPLESPPERLCILRLSAVGDVTHVVPVVRTLQRAWPRCRITWIIGRLEATLVGDLPGVEFIIFDKSAGPGALIDLYRRLRGRRFDVLLHMQVALRASLISLAVKAPVRLGFDAGRSRNGQQWFTTHRINSAPRQHVLDVFFAFAEALGIDERVLEWSLPVPDNERRQIAAQVPGDRPILAINPCSSARRRNWRNWPAERYAAVADYAATRHGLQVVLTGGPSEPERALARRIAALTETPVIDLIGQTSLKGLLALLEQATALIAPDTGPAHIATAAGTPVIGLYAASNPDRTGPYLSRQWVVNRYPQALVRYADKTVEQAAWGERVRHPEVMELIPVEAVRQSLDRLMASR
jgi:heptosyltransferase I